MRAFLLPLLILTAALSAETTKVERFTPEEVHFSNLPPERQAMLETREKKRLKKQEVELFNLRTEMFYKHGKRIDGKFRPGMKDASRYVASPTLAKPEEYENYKDVMEPHDPSVREEHDKTLKKSEEGVETRRKSIATNGGRTFPSSQHGKPQKPSVMTNGDLFAELKSKIKLTAPIVAKQVPKKSYRDVDSGKGTGNDGNPMSAGMNGRPAAGRLNPSNNRATGGRQPRQP